MSEREPGHDERRAGDDLTRRAALRSAVVGAGALAGVGTASAGGTRCDPHSCSIHWKSYVAPGNPTYRDVGCHTALTVEPVRSGTYYFRVDGKRYYLKLRVRYRNHEPVKVSFCSNYPIKKAVVKGGPKANVYTPNGHSDPSKGRNFSCGKWFYAPQNPNSGKYYAISHVDFCVGKVPVEKPDDKRRRERDERKKRDERREERDERREEREEEREERREKREEEREEREEEREEREEERERESEGEEDD